VYRDIQTKGPQGLNVSGKKKAVEGQTGYKKAGRGDTKNGTP
jgi:hypothetical protein